MIQFSKLTITNTGHRATQYKKVIDTLPVLCIDKNYQGINDVIWYRIDLVEADFIPIYSDASQLSNTHQLIALKLVVLTHLHQKTIGGDSM